MWTCRVHHDMAITLYIKASNSAPRLAQHGVAFLQQSAIAKTLRGTQKLVILPLLAVNERGVVLLKLNENAAPHEGGVHDGYQDGCTTTSRICRDCLSDRIYLPAQTNVRTAMIVSGDHLVDAPEKWLLDMMVWREPCYWS